MIQIRNIHKTFGNNTILRGVDLDVAKGQVVVILGPSGSGKTTFLRCLNALEIPEQGSICFEREPIVSINFATQHSKKDILALRRKSGMVFQQYNLFPHKTALENIMEAPVQVQGKPKAQAREEALALLAKVGLADKADLYPYQLSGGQQQRVGIARALALQPELMLFDEPFTGLDPISLGVIAHLIHRVTKALRSTSIMVTHDVGHSLNLVDQIIFLAHGEIVFSGSPAEMENSDSAWVRQFVRGEPNGPVAFRYPAKTSLQQDLWAAKS